MSKYPDNPYWCGRHDRPRALSRSEWEDAQQRGLLTPEHVLARLSDILEYALGNGAELGFDEDGFLIALVADGHRLTCGVTVRLCTRDHPPPHAHVEIKGQPRRHLRIDLLTGDFLDTDVPPGLRRQLRVAREFVAAHRDSLLARWSEIEAASPAHA